MGKGDKKTRRGKIAMGTFGNARPKRTDKPVPVAAAKPKASKAKTKK
jgi:30S ribosomal protein S31